MPDPKALPPVDKEIPTGCKEIQMSDQNIAQSDLYIVDQIMPTHSVHLIGGPSASGKTTLIIEIIEDWVQGRPIFGYESYPRPYMYVAADRPEAAFRYTLKRVRPKVDIPYFSPTNARIPKTIEAIIARARKLDPKVEVLFIDGIHALVPGGKINDYKIVADFVTKLYCLCEQHNLTIIAIGHTAKTKTGEEYHDPRQRFLGSVAWGGSTDCMIDIQPKENLSRSVSLLPRNAPELIVSYHFSSQGRLVDGEIEDAAFLLGEQLQKLEAGQPHTTSHFLELGEKLGLSPRTVYSWLKIAVRDGLLEKTKKGTYRVPWKT